jgi:hypothetical protein
VAAAGRAVAITEIEAQLWLIDYQRIWISKFLH